MKSPIEILNSDYDDSMTVDITLSNICNYSCHYCHPGSNEGTDPFPKNYEVFVKNLDHLLEIYKTEFNKKRIKVELTGGEPTLWPKLDCFARHLKLNHPEIFCLQVTTNASRTLRWWKDNSKVFDEIHISLHKEADTEKVIEIADYIYYETGSFVSVNVILDPTDWDRSLNYLNKMVVHPTPWLVKSWLLVDGTTIRSDYTPEQLEQFEDRVKKKPPDDYIESMLEKGFISKPSNTKIVYDDGSVEDFVKLTLKRNPGDNNFNGWACNVGIDRISIIFGNLLASCGARYLYNIEPPFSLYSEDFINRFSKEIIHPTTCREISCGSCTKDLRVPKKRTEKRKKVISIDYEK